MEKSTWEILEEKIPNIKIYLVLIVITFIAYANILPNQFVWEDEMQISNPLVQTSGHLLKLVLSHNFSGTPDHASFYRPIMNLSFWISYRIFGPAAWGFHLVQLLFHTTNVLLIFIILNKLFGVAGIKSREKIAFLSAAIFAVHAGVSEAVQYISSIGEIFFVLFSLLSFYKLLTGINYETREIRTANIIWSAIFGFFAIASKESALAIFVIGLAYLFFFLKPNVRTYLKYLAGAGSATLIYFTIHLLTGGISYTADQPVPIAKASLAIRLMTIPKEILTYIKIFFWPAKLQVYQDFIVSSLNFHDFWLPLLIIIVLAIIFLLGTRRLPTKIRNLYWLLGLGCSLLLLPTLNIVPLDMTLAERWLYFPSIFLIAITLLFLFSLFEYSQQKTNILATILLVAIIPILTVRTIVRNNNWRSDYTLFGHDIKSTNGENANIEINFGYALLHAGNLPDAKVHFERSIEIMGDYTVSLNNLGVVFEREGDLEKARAYYQKAVEIADYNLAFENFASILMQLKQYNEAYIFSQKAIQKFPNDPILYFDLALMEYQRGNKTEAKNFAETSLRLDPNNQKVQQFYTTLQSGYDIIFEQ